LSKFKKWRKIDHENEQKEMENIEIVNCEICAQKMWLVIDLWKVVTFINHHFQGFTIVWDLVTAYRGISGSNSVGLGIRVYCNFTKEPITMKNPNTFQHPPKLLRVEIHRY
jgi:hypothetical protein